MPAPTAFRWWRWALASCGSAGMASTRGARSGATRARRVAFLNTDVAASFAAITWMVVGWWQEKRPTFVGLLTGAVAGLATITPAAGYVSPLSSVIIGLIAGVVCYYAVALKNRLKWDDALDVWGVHGVGGALGVVLLGFLATTAFNPGGAQGFF